MTNSGNGTESTSSNSVGEDAVCGSDNETYSSLCQLIQTTTTVSVAHSGPCEDPKCQGGEVSYGSLSLSFSFTLSLPLSLNSQLSVIPSSLLSPSLPHLPHTLSRLSLTCSLSLSLSIQVCGSDGVTYPNSCELESLSSTRVDYPGACESGGSAELICIAVLTKGRCVVNSGNCRRLVFPQDGCCPICGEINNLNKNCD